MTQTFKIRISSWEDRQNFRPSWYSIFFNPYFIARWHLFKKIRAFAASVSDNKKILDVGCGNKPYKDLFKNDVYAGIDIEGGGHSRSSKKPDKFFDGQSIPYADEEFDIAISTQVLEHAQNPEKLLSEMARVLKRDGVLFLTMPFVWDEHEEPFDFRRFTSFGHRQIFTRTNLAIQSIQKTTGVFGTTGQLISAFLAEGFSTLVDKLPIKYRFKFALNKLFALMVCCPAQFAALVCDSLFLKKGITLDYAVTAQKS